MSLTFNERNHTYRLDGKAVPGVTTLIDKGLPKPQLIRWSAKAVAEFVADNAEHVRQSFDWMDRDQLVAMLKQTPWSQRDKAAVRGTDVHDIAEQLIHGTEVEVPEHLAGYVDAAVAFLDQWRVVPLVVERPVGNRKWWYAGKPDVIATICDGRTALIDYKTSGSGIFGSTSLQMVAYAQAEFFVDAEGNEQPLPQVDVGLAVHLRPDGYDVYEMRVDEEAFNAFLHVAWVGKRAKDIDGWRSEPLPSPASDTGATA